MILVKNLPTQTARAELEEVFTKFGTIGKLVLPPSGITAIIEFQEPSEAKHAFTKLAYTRVSNTVMLCAAHQYGFDFFSGWMIDHF